MSREEPELYEELGDFLAWCETCDCIRWGVKPFHCVSCGVRMDSKPDIKK